MFGVAGFEGDDGAAPKAELGPAPDEASAGAELGAEPPVAGAAGVPPAADDEEEEPSVLSCAHTIPGKRHPATKSGSHGRGKIMRGIRA
jgi:hypothetical protein